MRNQETSVAVLPAPLAGEARPDPAFAQVVTIAALTADGQPQVLLRTNGPLVTARLALPATRERLQRAVSLQQKAVIVFEDGDRSTPLIVGFLEQVEAPATDAPESAAVEGGPVTGAERAARIATPATSQETTAEPVFDGDIDGRRLRITAKDEIVLQCGQASITLRRNGRVIVRGTYVETHSDGTNRIKGGQVQIN